MTTTHFFLGFLAGGVVVAVLIGGLVTWALSASRGAPDPLADFDE